MFIYLSKKIAIPNNTKLKSIAWNKEHGYIACGGDDGLLKVLKLEQNGKDIKVKGLAAPSNLAMNQTLEGHNGQILVVGWNENHQKLTSSDQNGLIIVWMLYKGSWYEEMINNRNKSVVKGMDWNSDGSRICIVYEDGAVIVGSVDGNRIWGKELKSPLNGVCWSPDSKYLLFSLQNNEVHVYDDIGNYNSKVMVHVFGLQSRIVSLLWYNGRYGAVYKDAPSLVMLTDKGKMQLMKGKEDENPILIDVGMTAFSCCWSHDGSILAIAGTMFLSGEGSTRSESNVVQFYSPFGDPLRTLKVPGKQITCCAWEGGSLRIALSVDSFIYFANIRPDYKWMYLSNTIVYTYNRSETNDAAVVFWNYKTGEKNYKYVKVVYSMSSHEDHGVLAVDIEHNSGEFIHTLILCNSLGTRVDSKQLVHLSPNYVAMTSTQIFAASKNAFFIWQFRTTQTWTSLNVSNDSESKKEIVCFIDDENPGVFERNEAEKPPETNDSICCLTASDKYLVIGRDSGKLQVYMLPNAIMMDRYSLMTKPHKVALNCNSTVLSAIDVTGQLKLIDIEGNRSKEDNGELNRFERKDVWDIKWAADNPDLFAMMEKTRMYVFRSLQPEDPILSSGYICSFKDLEIKSVLLDEILKDPDTPSEDLVLSLEVKCIRETREILEKNGVKEAMNFIEDNSHPHLWKILAEAAVEVMDTQTAEAAFVRRKDYSGIQFIKRLNTIQNEALKTAEVAARFQKYDLAEKLYIEQDRIDLAIDLRRKLGDWFRVLTLLKSGAGSDVELEECWNNIGEHYAIKHQWADAVPFFEKSKNTEKLIDCYYHLENYDSLENIIDQLQPNDFLLETLGDMFISVGMWKQAVDCYTKCEKISKAIDSCVNLNQWHEAVELVTKYNQPSQISSLLAKYAKHLLEENKTFQAIELYRKAYYFLEAAKLLINLAQEETLKQSSSPLHIKKLYILSGLMVEEHIKQSSKEGSSTNALMGVLISGNNSTADMNIVDKAWRGAEAYHFFILAQQQLHSGSVDAAMKTCLHLRHFEDILNEEDIYSLLALSSCANHSFGTCSRAFIKLESLEGLKNEYQELAMDIFTKHAPKDSRSNRAECANCETMIPDWVSSCPACQTKFPACIVTGRPLMNITSVWSCPVCHHQAYEQDITMRQSCPLCHASIRN